MALYWLALGVSCVAGGIVLIGVGYLVGLRVATRHAAGLVTSLRTDMDRERATHRTMLHQGGAQ